MGLLDFVLRALRLLRPCDPRNDATLEKSKKFCRKIPVFFVNDFDDKEEDDDEDEDKDDLMHRCVGHTA